jgi:hypothetical protein
MPLTPRFALRHVGLAVVVAALFCGAAAVADTAPTAAKAPAQDQRTGSGPSPWWTVVAGLTGTVFGGGVSVVTSLVNNRHQRRLAADNAVTAKELEALRAEIGTGAKATEKRAAVAADVLLACLDVVDGMEAVASVAGIVADPEKEIAEDLRDWHRRKATARWDWLKQYDERFDRAYVMAQVYLPDNVCDALERLRKLKWSIHVDQLGHAELVHYGGRQDAQKFFSGGFGAEPTKQIRVLRDELKILLRPLAQMATKKEAAPAGGCADSSR